MCVCPLNYAEEVPLEEVPHAQRPELSTATGKTITVYGKRCVKYRLDHSLTLSITYWVCDVQHPLLSVRSLMKSNLQLVFSPQRCYINKSGTDKLVTLVEHGPLYYLPTQGRTTTTSTSSTSTLQTQPTTTSTSTSLQLDKTDLYNTYKQTNKQTSKHTKQQQANNQTNKQSATEASHGG